MAEAMLEIRRGPAILTVRCNEPEGVFNRELWFMQLYPENLRALWDKASKFRMLFGTEISGDFKKFAEVFLSQGSDEVTANLNGLFWIVDDFVGAFYMTRIQPGLDADVHYAFFDRRHKGRLELARAMFRYVFDRYKFRRLTAEMPLNITPDAYKFAERLGFKNEGRKRKAAYFDGQFFDVNVFGLLKEELSDAS